MFNRDGRRVTLTVAGEALLEEARAILDAAARADARLRDVTSGSVGRVRLGATATAGLFVLPAIVRDYRAACPAYECRLWIGSAAAVEDRVVRNELDMAVVAGPRPHGELRARELGPDRFVLIAPPARAPRRARTPDLQGAWVLREEGSDARRQTVRWLARKRVKPSCIVTVEGPAAVTEAVASGLGLALTSARAAEAAISAGRVVPLDAGPALPARAFWLADHPHKHHGAACQAMLAMITSSADRPTRSRS
mgnify:CR=1 FL=1